MVDVPFAGVFDTKIVNNKDKLYVSCFMCPQSLGGFGR
jgi:hypothetical protein